MEWDRARRKSDGQAARAFEIVGLDVWPPDVSVKTPDDILQTRVLVFHDQGCDEVKPLRGDFLVAFDGEPYRYFTAAQFRDEFELLAPVLPPPPPPPVGTDTPLTPIVHRFYDFKPGEGLPTHVHTPEQNHITVVLSGSLRCTGRPAIEGQVIKAGDVLDWIAGEPHGFLALEDCRILQIRK